MRILMISSLTVFAMLAGCAFEEENDPAADSEFADSESADSESADSEGLDDPAAAASEEALLADQEAADRELAKLDDGVPDEDIAQGVPDQVAVDEAVALAPCGLDIFAQGDGKVFYTIRNCHSFRVKRELDVVNWWDICECHDIAAGQTVEGACARTSIRGIKDC
jgi:hypothetical protein